VNVLLTGAEHDRPSDGLVTSVRHDNTVPPHHNVHDPFTRSRCASCTVRQVALGAIVASHLYNTTHH